MPRTGGSDPASAARVPPARPAAPTALQGTPPGLRSPSLCPPAARLDLQTAWPVRLIPDGRCNRSARSIFLSPHDAFFLSHAPRLVILQFFTRPDSPGRSTIRDRGSGNSVHLVDLIASGARLGRGPAPAASPAPFARPRRRVAARPGPHAAGTRPSCPQHALRLR